MGDELGSETDMDSLFVSSGWSAPIFTLIGNDDFWSCRAHFRPKMSPKLGNFGCSWISRRNRVGFSNCLDLHILYTSVLRMHYGARVSASNFQVIVCSGSRDTTLRTVVLILAGPVRMTDRIFTFGAAPTQVQVLGTNHWALELDHF